MVDIQFGHFFVGFRSTQVLVELFQSRGTCDNTGDLLAPEDPGNGKLGRGDAHIAGHFRELLNDLDPLRGDAFLDPAVIIQ